VVFAVVLFTHCLSPVITSFDSMFSIHIAASILREGNTDLDEYRAQIAARDSYGVEEIPDPRQPGESHLRSFFPIWPSVTAVPLVWLVDVSGRLGITDGLDEILVRPHWFEEPLIRMPSGWIERFVGSVMMALASVFIFLMARTCLGPVGSMVLATVFAFGTPSWSIASRGLWQHTPSIMFMSATLLTLLRAEKSPRSIVWAGPLLACAYLVRPTNSVAVAVLTLFVLIRHPRKFVFYLLLSLPFVALFFLHNRVVCGMWLQPYYAPGRLGENPDFWSALAANWVSPGRGILIFSPILLLCAVSVWLRAARREFTLLDGSLLVILAGHTLAVSSFPAWWAGYSFGPRFMSDVTPLLICLLIPVVQEIGRGPRLKRAALGALFTALAGASFFIHLRGATVPAVHEWNNVPDEWNNVPDEEMPAHVWDWGDLQFLRRAEDMPGPKFRANLQASHEALRAREWEIMLTEAEAAIAIWPNEGEPHGMAAIALMQLGRRERSLDEWILALSHIDGPETDNLVSSARLVLEREGISISQALASGEAGAWHCEQVARSLERSSALDDSLQAWERGIALAPRDVDLHLGRSRVLNRLGRFEESLVASRTAQEIDPQMPWAAIYDGDNLQALGRTEEARHAWQRALTLPNHSGAHELARMRLQQTEQ
jgi:tetratricopeptide (TPR) repeat protein